MTRLSRNSAGWLLTAALHVVLLGFMLARPITHAPQTAENSRTTMVWLRPLLPTPPKRVPNLPRQPPLRIERAPSALPSSLPPLPALKDDKPDTPASPDSAADPLYAPQPPNAEELMRLARRDVGRIDRELRGGRAAPLQGGDQRQAKLDEAFSEASKAAGTWYQAPSVRELSVPMTGGGGDRVYEIRTGRGRYCVYVPADGSKTRTKACPREK
jgi:hypothetical protein